MDDETPFDQANQILPCLPEEEAVELRVRLDPGDREDAMRVRLFKAIGLAVPLLAALGSSPTEADDARVLQFTVDVAEDLSKFVYTPVIPGDIPRRGSTFITEGNIFPGGTIEGDGSDFDPNSPGSIGKWYCRGIHLVDAPEIPAAPLWVDTAQLFQFPDDDRSLSSDGLEGNSIILRAVTGGTGLLKAYVGEQRQQFRGFNISGGANLRVTFTLRKATR